MPIITYEKQKAKNQRLNFDSLANMDVKSFDSPIGGITNLASNLFALKENFKEGTEERKEIEKRIKLLRRFQGDAIDKAKGISYTPPPSFWSKRKRYLPITDGMTEEQIKETEEINKKIYFDNSVCCSKKAYFFGYVYPKLMEDYKKHKKVYNNISYGNFNMSINDLIKIADKSTQQKLLLKRYYNHSPLFNSKSTMNILCKYIEDFDFDFRFKKKTNNFDYTIYMTKKPKELDKKILEDMYFLVKEHIHIYSNMIKNFNISKDFLSEEESSENRSIMMDAFFDYFKMEILKITKNEEDAINYLVEVIYNQKNGPKYFIWYCFGDELVKNVKKNSKHRYSIVKDENGFDYFGRKYSLIDNPAKEGETE